MPGDGPGFRQDVIWRLEAAALPPSTARKALVIATVILLVSKGTTVPLRLMTRICPGAVAAMLALTVALSRVWVALALVIGGVALGSSRARNAGVV